MGEENRTAASQSHQDLPRPEQDAMLDSSRDQNSGADASRTRSSRADELTTREHDNDEERGEVY